MNRFVDYFSRFAVLTPEEQQAIADHMTVKTFAKGDYLLREGQLSTDTYFILAGCVREYVMVDGEERTTGFFTDGQWVISLNNFDAQQPSDRNLVCTDPTEVSIGNEEEAQKLFRLFPRFETIARAIVEAGFAEQKRQLTSYLTDSPEQRYLKLVKERPELLQRAPQYYIASYIGVKPESLSRIRKRVLEKQKAIR